MPSLKDFAKAIAEDKKFQRKKVQNINSNDDISRYIAGLLMDEPFFGHILLHTNFARDDKIGTAGVSIQDSDVYMFWAKEFMDSLNTNETRGLLKHECFHLVFQHCTKRMLKPHDIANIAADLAINCAIPKEELPVGGWNPGERHIDYKTELPDDTPFADLIAKLPKHKSYEWYFTKLMDSDVVKQLQKEAGEGGEIVIGSGFDEHDQWGELTAEEQELVKGKINELLKEAVNKADRTNRWGTVGAEMREQLRILISNVVDWKALLRQFVKTSRRGKTTTTWTSVHMSNLDENYGPGCPGKRRGYESRIWVYIDQSGSMSDDDLRLGFGELASFVKRTEFTTFHFDTEVDLKSQLHWKGKGVPAMAGLRTRSGGTDFTAATVHANQLGRKECPDGVIILTDGGAPKPPKSRVKRCYLLVPGTKLAFEPDPEDVVITMVHPIKTGE